MSSMATNDYVASRVVGQATVSAISDGSGRSAIMQALIVPREEWRREVEANDQDEIILGYNVAHVRLGAASILIDSHAMPGACPIRPLRRRTAPRLC